MATATVNSRGQITNPAEGRAALRLNQEFRVEFFEQEGGQFAIVAVSQPVKRLKGMIHPPRTPVSIDDLNVGVDWRSRS